jgi:hypothetical protein
MAGPVHISLEAVKSLRSVTSIELDPGRVESILEIALSNAVKAAAAKAGPDTLIVVSADHSHVFTIAGYPDRGNPILGLVKVDGQPIKDSLGLPYTTLGYANGPGTLVQ